MLRRPSLTRRRFLALSASAVAATGATAAARTRSRSAALPALGDHRAYVPGVVGPEPQPVGWSAESHSNDVDPNFDLVFARDAVKTLAITIPPEHWHAMLLDLTAIFGARGGGLDEFDPDEQLPTPIWVPATLAYDGRTWLHVGIRFKGSYSLAYGWSRSVDRLPFKLDFDEFEDEFPVIDNQRFYGFKQLSLSTGIGDGTFFRESVAADLFAAAGVPVSRAAPWNIVLDYGEGPVPLGVYTLVEVVEDTLVDRLFEDNDGNLYEAEGPAASFELGTEAGLTSSFQAESDDADWLDLTALYHLLHSPTRLTAPDQWRDQVDALFAVDTFFRALAVGALLLHWDTYGATTQNFYLYTDPTTGRITWIAWDHNFTLGASADGDGQTGPGGLVVSFDKENVDDSWPLIRFLLDDSVFRARYEAAVEEVIEANPLESLYDRFDALGAIVEPILEGQAALAFQANFDRIKEVADRRFGDALDYLATL